MKKPFLIQGNEQFMQQISINSMHKSMTVRIVFWAMVILSLMKQIKAADTSSEAEEQPNRTITWGQETNGIKAGLLVLPALSAKTGPESIEVLPVIYLNSTNSHFWTVWIPPERQRFKISVYDENNRPMKMTNRGKALGRTIRKNLRSELGSSYQRDIIAPNKNNFGIAPFLLSDFFLFEKPGKYRMQFELSIVHQTSELQIIKLSPVILYIEVGSPSEDAGK